MPKYIMEFEHENDIPLVLMEVLKKIIHKNLNADVTIKKLDKETQIYTVV